MRNIKKALFLLSFFIGGQARAQTAAKDSADFRFSQLDNNSVSVVHNAFTVSGMRKEAAGLYLNADKHIIDTLIDLLADTNRTLACHVLLTALIEPNHQTVYYTTEDLTEAILVSYRYNGFAWQTLYDKVNLATSIKIEPAIVKSIQQYWLARKEKFVCALRAEQ